MQQFDAHSDYVRARHSDLLRQARSGELAAQLAASRREDRRSLFSRLRARRAEGGAATATSH
jgi:hypothetical protein